LEAGKTGGYTCWGALSPGSGDGKILITHNPAVFFVNSSLGTRRFEDEDRPRSYLSLGTLTSALKNRDFLKRDAERLGKKELIFDSVEDYPE